MDAEIYKKAKQYFAAANCNISGAARMLRDKVELSNDDIVRVVISPDGLKQSIESAVLAVLAGLDLSLKEGVKALYDGEILPEEIAKALHGEMINLSADKVAWALREGCNLSNEGVAEMLHSVHGLDLRLNDLARVLYSRVGLDLEPVTVVEILDDIGFDPDVIVKALSEGCGLTKAHTTAAVNKTAVGSRVGLSARAHYMDPVLKEPASYKTASEIRAAKNTSKKGIK